MTKLTGKHKKDLSGKEFGRLKVIKFIGSDKRSNSVWLVECSCGETFPFEVVGYRLTNGKCKSCGCLQRELFSERSKAQRKYPVEMSRLYIIWSGMKQRCFNKKAKVFKSYGGKGITVCDDWKNSFQNFMEWSIENGYDDSLTIDRINVLGNYEPSNCRWITIGEQQQNKRNTFYLEIGEETKTLKEWSILSGLKYMKIYDRIKNGWKKEDLLSNLEKKPVYKE